MAIFILLIPSNSTYLGYAVWINKNINGLIFKINGFDKIKLKGVWKIIK